MQSSRRSDNEWQGLVSEVRVRAACCGNGLISARSTAVHMEDESSGVIAKQAEKSRIKFTVHPVANTRLTVQASKRAFLNVRLTHLWCCIYSIYHIFSSKITINFYYIV